MEALLPSRCEDASRSRTTPRSQESQCDSEELDVSYTKH